MPETVDLTFIEDETRRVRVAEDMAIVWDRGRMRWDHLCEVVPDPERGHIRKRIAAFLSDDRPGGHRLVSEDPLTIEGSLLCLGCGRHGWVTDGEWRPA